MLCNALQSQISNDVHLQQSHGKQTSIFQILRSVSEHTLWYHARQACHKETDMDLRFAANIEFRVPYSQRYLFYAIPDTNHNVTDIPIAITGKLHSQSAVKYILVAISPFIYSD